MKFGENLVEPYTEGKMIWNKKRRSQRLALSVPVVAYRSEKLGLPFSEGTRTLVVSAHGALISLAAKVAADQGLVLKHALSGEEQECRVVFTQKKLMGQTEVGIEFRQPAPNFWHIAFPPIDWTPPAPLVFEQPVGLVVAPGNRPRAAQGRGNYLRKGRAVRRPLS